MPVPISERWATIVTARLVDASIDVRRELIVRHLGRGEGKAAETDMETEDQPGAEPRPLSMRRLRFSIGVMRLTPLLL